MPKATIAGHALIVVIAMMTLLASIIMDGGLLFRAVAGDWRADLAREVDGPLAATGGARPRDGKCHHLAISRANTSSNSFSRDENPLAAPASGMRPRRLVHRGCFSCGRRAGNARRRTGTRL